MDQRREQSRGEVRSLDKLCFKRHKKEKNLKKKRHWRDKKTRGRGRVIKRPNKELVDKKNTIVHWKLNQTV